MLRAIWIVVLLGAGAFAAFGSADSGSFARTVAAQAAVTSAGDVTSRDAAVQSGVAAVGATIRSLTAVIAAVSRRWWWPIEASFAVMQDTIHRGWSAIRRLPGPNQARP